MRKQSLNARTMHSQPYTAETAAYLVYITHPDLAVPVRLSTDPTDTLSDDTFGFGTYSTWFTSDLSPFLFVLASVLLPDDQADVVPTAQLVLDAVDYGIVDVLRSTTDRATVNFAMVLVATPNIIEAEWQGLELLGVEYSGSEITLQVSGEALHTYPFPADRMTKNRCPALFP